MMKRIAILVSTGFTAQGELVKMHTEIGNSAVNEYNAFVTEMSKKKPDTTK